MGNIKQVIVMRTDLGMRKGKMIAQGAHASMKFLVDRVNNYAGEDPHFSLAEIQWMEGLFTKICVRVDSEEELIDIHTKAIEAGIVSELIVDSGLTEFNGIPTKTCLALGPDQSEKIDEVTGHLRLL